MKLAFDDQIFTRQRRGGISRYFVEMMRRVAHLEDIEVQVPWRFHINEHARDAGIGSYIPRSNSRLTEAAFSRLSGMLNRWQQPDPEAVLHTTYYALNPESVSRRQVLTTTIYDMTPERWPELFPQGNPHLRKADWVCRADSVIAISESTRRDLLEFIDVDPDKVVVIPWGVGEEFSTEGPTVAEIGSPSVLFVGARKSYKDFRVLLEALDFLSDSYRQEIDLVIVGAQPLTPSEKHVIGSLSSVRRIHFLSPKDEQLPAVYRSCSAFVFPSRYEGFGLPTLEAMACGTPVILARSSSHVEVGADAAVFFEPQDATSLATCLDGLLRDSSMWQDYRERGLAHAKENSWNMTAALFMDHCTRLTHSR